MNVHTTRLDTNDDVYSTLGIKPRLFERQPPPEGTRNSSLLSTTANELRQNISHSEARQALERATAVLMNRPHITPMYLCKSIYICTYRHVNRFKKQTRWRFYIVGRVLIIETVTEEHTKYISNQDLLCL